MLSGLSELGQAYLSILNVYSLAYGLGGALLGIIVGCLPGLSATLCIALLTTLTIKMAPNDAILILICSYVGTLYGGSRTAILLNIPGTAANAASCADGHALRKRGLAGSWTKILRRRPLARDGRELQPDREFSAVGRFAVHHARAGAQAAEQRSDV